MDEHDTSKASGQSPSRKYLAAGRYADGFSLVPNAVVRDKGLSGNAKAMWAILYDLVHYRKEEPTEAELGELLGAGEKAARSALRELRDAGLAETVRRGRGMTNAHCLLDPPETKNGREGRSKPKTRPEGRSRTALRAEASFKDVEQDTEGAKDAPSGRARDLVFDAVAEATDAIVETQNTMIAKVAVQIRAAEAPEVKRRSERFLAENPSYDEVPRENIDKWLAARVLERARMYRERKPDLILTPTALATHWKRIPTWKPERGRGLSPSELANLDLDAA